MDILQTPSGFSSEAIAHHVGQYGPDRLLLPADVASLLNVSLKWLANLREGRSQFKGPPFVKLGKGRTSPIRYPLGDLSDWIASQPRQTHTTCHRFQDFLETGMGRWLYLVNDEALLAREFFGAINDDIHVSQQWRPRWLTAADVKAKRFFSAGDRLLTAAALRLDWHPQS